MIRKITSVIIIVITLTIIGWDVYAYLNADNSTISVVMTDWSRSSFGNLIVLFWGILMGHWFIPARGTSDK